MDVVHASAALPDDPDIQSMMNDDGCDVACHHLDLTLLLPLQDLITSSALPPLQKQCNHISSWKTNFAMMFFVNKQPRLQIFAPT